jgi:hypothetical protein
MQTQVFASNPLLRRYWYAVARSGDVAPGSLFRSSSGATMSRSWWQNAASSSPMRQCATGAGSSGKRTRINDGIAVPDLGTSGTLLKSSAAFVVRGTISGGRSIKMAMCSVSWCNGGETRPRRRSSFAFSRLMAPSSRTSARGATGSRPLRTVLPDDCRKRH